MQEIQLLEMFYILRKRIWIILLIVVFSVTTSGIISYFVLEPEYETFTTLMVGKSQGHEDLIEYSDILLNQKLVTTYGEIAKSRLVSNEVIENLDLNISYESLKGKLNVSLVSDTEIIKIEVRDNNPDIAAKIANETAKVFIEHITKIMKIENIQVIDTAVIPINHIKPRPILNMILAGMLGCSIAVFLTLLLEQLDNTIKTEDDVERYLELMVIGIIPEENQKFK